MRPGLNSSAPKGLLRVRKPRLLQGVMIAGLMLAAVTVTFGETQSEEASSQRTFFRRVFGVLRSERYDPTDPTQLSTFTELAVQLNEVRTSEGHGLTYGVKLTGSYVLEAVDNYALGFELPLLQSDIPGLKRQFGLGDITMNNTFVPYRKEDLDGWFNAAGLFCSVTMPTGQFDAGLGAGNWLVAPALLLSFEVGPVRAFPSVGYQFAFAGSGTVGRNRAPLSEGPLVNTVLAGPVPDPYYIAITPQYFYDRLAASNPHAFSLTLQMGRMLGKRWNQSIELKLTREWLQETGNVISGQVAYVYYY